MPTEPAHADTWKRLADAGRVLLVGAALVAPLARRDSRTSFDALTAILATSATSKALKAMWREPRPNGENSNSFPSQHASECFAAAMMLDSKWKNFAGPAAIGLATAISMARLFSGKHHLVDVLAGAAIGITAANLISGRASSA